MPILIVENVEKVYEGGERGVVALRGVSFQVEAGEFVALMGPSGCGKSTLLHLIGAVDRPTRGQVLLNDIAFHALGEEKLASVRRKKIGFVFQFFNLLPTLTVEENVSLPLLLDGAGDKQTRDSTLALLDRVGLSHRAKHHPAELSGGEMQRAAVARASIARPELLLADEPTGNLDTENGEQVMKLLADLNREMGVTIILATHSEEAARFARRIIRMRDGLIVADALQKNEGVLQTL